MLHAYLGEAKFWHVLQRIDEDLAAATRARGCVHCAGVLHRADYPRKPRGVPRVLLGESYERRLSLCCAREGCRRRTTPASVRFLARRVYLGALVVLVSSLAQGVSTRRRLAVCERFGVSVRTVLRWQRWWRAVFPATRWWQAGRGQFIPPPLTDELPGGLIACFGDTATPLTLAKLLRWLGPISVHVR